MKRSDNSLIQSKMLNAGSAENPMQNMMMLWDYSYRMSDLEKNIADVSRRVEVIESNYATKTDLAQLETKLTEQINISFRWTLGIILPIVFSLAGGGLYLLLDFQKETNQRFHQVETQMNAFDVRLTKVELRLDRVEQRLDVVEKKLDSIDDKLDLLLQQAHR